MPTPLMAVILAAKEGDRMNSAGPKVLQTVAGQPMIDYILDNARAAGASQTFIVVGEQARDVVSHVGKRAVPVVQKHRLGTGHAVQQLLPRLKSFKGNLLVLYGDSCLVRPQTLMALRQFHQFQDSAITLLTAVVQDPFGYGRVFRDRQGNIERVVEESRATEEERKVKEVSGGVYLFKAKELAKALHLINPKSVVGEYDLTDTVRLILREGGKAQALTVPDASEILGINDQKQLTQAHRSLSLRRIEEHQRNGVTFLNPKTVEIGSKVQVGPGSLIEGNVQLHGETTIGKGCRIESGSYLHSAKLGRGVVIKFSRIVESQMGDGCDAGPFAHVRGGSVLDKQVHVGTNAELKNAKIGSGGKVGHFSYVGDAVLGKEVNVGAGCVFANYDGKDKHECRVGDKAFLGSNSTLVAPVKIGNKAVVGAGAVVTRDVPAGTTVVGVPAKPVKKRK